MNSYPAPLPAEEQIVLCARAQAGDRRARDKLVATSMRFVAKRAAHFARLTKGADPEDFEGAGAIGLMKAIEKFDAAKGAGFITYAAAWIDNAIRRGGVDLEREVTASVSSRGGQFLKAYRRHRASGLAHREAVEATASEKSAKAETVEANVAALTRPKAASLDAPMSNSDGDGGTLLDVLPGDDEGTEDRFVREEECEAAKRKIAKLRSKLGPREQAILDKRILADGDEATLQDVADLFGLSRERIRQLEAHLMLRLKSVLGRGYKHSLQSQRDYMRARRAKHARLGLCSVCVNAALDGLRMCRQHLTMWLDRGRESRRRRGIRQKRIWVAWNGETLHLSAWARRVGIQEQTLIARWHAGWGAERCMTELVKPGQRPRTACKRGHPLSADNVYTFNGMRSCRTCSKERHQERRRLRDGTCFRCGAASPGHFLCQMCRDKQAAKARGQRSAKRRAAAQEVAA